MSRPGVTSRDKSSSDAGDGRRRLSLVISAAYFALSAACFALSTAGAIACAVISLLSSVPVPPVPVVIWGPLAVGMFPLILLAIGRHQNENRWLKPAFALAIIHENENRWLKPAIALAIICFLSGFVQLAHGVPEIIHGAYYQDSHGTLTRVSHDTYLWAARAEARMASGVLCLFYVVAAGSYAERWLDD